MNNEKPFALSGLDSDTFQKAIYSLPPKEIYPILKTCEYGLSAEEAQSRLDQFGPNKLAEAKKKSLLLMFLKNFTHLDGNSVVGGWHRWNYRKNAPTCNCHLDGQCDQWCF